MKIIVNADDFGISRTVNRAVINGIKNGILTSVSVIPNMPAFEDAMRKFNTVENIGLGIHLNISEYKSKLRTKEKNSKLYDNQGKFNNNFFQILTKSNDEDFMFEVEHEFRSQIEAVLKYAQPDHLNSHSHIHSIPKIFNLVCELAKEYGIPAIRTQNEHFYLTEKLKDKTQWKNWLNNKFYKNFIYREILKYFSEINKTTLNKFSLKSNDFSIGIGYSGMMDFEAIKEGIKTIKNQNGILEIICHPDLNEQKLSNLIEYKSICDSEMKKYIENFELISFKNYAEQEIPV